MKLLLSLTILSLVLVGCSQQGRLATDFPLPQEEDYIGPLELKNGLKSLDQRLKALESQHQQILDYLGVVEWKEDLPDCMVSIENRIVNNCGRTVQVNEHFGETILTKDPNKVEWVKLGCEDLVSLPRCIDMSDSRSCAYGEKYDRCQSLKELIKN